MARHLVTLVAVLLVVGLVYAADEPNLTGKWSGKYTAGAKGKTSLELKETKNGKFIGTWTDRLGTNEIKGTRTSNKMAFSYTYQHPKFGEAKGDVAGEISADGKSLTFKGVESGKDKAGQPWVEKWEADLKRE